MGRGGVRGLWWVVFLSLLAMVVWVSRWPQRLFYPVYYRTEINRAAAAYGVDPYLIMAIIKVESNFRCWAVSRKGARGLMQVMPATADWIAGEGGPLGGSGALDDPASNIAIGTWYLAYLLERYKGKNAPAIAAYNAGEARVDQWLADRLWDGRVETAHQIPYGETRGYIRRVTVAHARYRQLYPPEGSP